MLLAEIKNIYHKELGELYPKEEVNSFFYMMIEHYLGLERFVLAVRPDLIISKEEEGPLFAALSDLKVQRPIQHILEKAHFMDLEFAVNENVLIPRPETEELVRWILKDCQAERSRSPYAENVKNSLNKENPSECQKNKDRPISILDIGTGSGCIAISLAKNLPHADVHALDVSPKALEVAKKNAVANDVDIKWIEADVLNLDMLTVNFDVIVSNPPYVRELEKKQMQVNVTDYEPGLALFVSDDDPLVFYRTIGHFSRKNLVKGGRLYIEINQYLADDTEGLLKECNFSEIELRKDMYGNDRMIRALSL